MESDNCRETVVPPLKKDMVRRATRVSLLVNFCLSLLKFSAGVLGHSQVVVADAVHSLSDMTTDIAILVGVKYWSRPADQTHPHGHHRLETMTTMGIGLVLSLVAASLLWRAVATLQQEHTVNSPGMVAFYAALLSVSCKEGLYRWTVSLGKSIKSPAIIANAWHQRSDALSSLPAVLAVAGAAADPRWAFLDHVGAIIVSLIIFKVSFGIVRPAFHILIDTGGSEEELSRIDAIVKQTAGVRCVHNIRTRYVGSESLAIDLHIEVNGDMSVREGHNIATAVKHRLLEQIEAAVDVIVHVEPYEKPGGGE